MPAALVTHLRIVTLTSLSDGRCEELEKHVILLLYAGDVQTEVLDH